MPEIVEMAQTSLIRIAGVQNRVIPVLGDFDNLKVEDESIDWIIEFDSLHHSFDLERTAKESYRVLKEGGFCVWVVADFRQGGKLIDFHGDTIQSFKKAGFNYHDIIIMENISPFATLTTFQAACKRYAPKVHEYILVFRKPGEYIVPEYCTENIVESVNKLNQFFG